MCISLSVIVNHRSREAAQYTHPSRADKCPKWLINSWIQIDCLTFPFANRDLKKKSNRFLDILLVTEEAGRPHISRGKVIDLFNKYSNHFCWILFKYIQHLTFKFCQQSSSEMRMIYFWWPQGTGLTCVLKKSDRLPASANETFPQDLFAENSLRSQIHQNSKTKTFPKITSLPTFT